MSDRILNFSEFFKRYSKQTNKENSLDTIMSSPQNFEDGFDETTYDKTQLGPNKPISTSYQATPAQPKFSKEKEQTMDAPDEDFDIEVEDEDETPEPEKMGANPAKTVAKMNKKSEEEEEEKVAESRILSFAKFSRTNEDYYFYYPEEDYPENLEKEEEDMPGWNVPKFRGYEEEEESGDGTFGANPMDDEDENPYSDIASFGMNPMGMEGDVYEEDMCPTCENPYEGTYSASANPGMKTCGGNPMTGSCGSNPYY
jgi:hypothetical protein